MKILSVPPIVKAAVFVLILEVAGAISLVVGLLTLHQAQADYQQTTQVARDTQQEVSAIIGYINEQSKSGSVSGRAFLTMLGEECKLLVDIERRLGDTRQEEDACKLLPLPAPISIPTPTPH